MEIERIPEKDYQNGIDIDLVLDEFKFYSDEFQCIICTNLVFDPLTCQNCKSFFCKKCIVTWLNTSRSCPNRCPKFVSEDFNRTLSLIINKIKLKCYYYKKGCNKILPYEKFNSHLNNCDYATYKCPNRNCSYLEQRNLVLAHIENCDFFVKYCEFCKINLPRKFFLEHNEKCSKMNIKCLLCGLELERGKYQNHVKNDCDKIGVECKRCKGSIDKSNYYIHVLDECNAIFEKNLKKECKIEIDKAKNEYYAMKKEFMDYKLNVTNQDKEYKDSIKREKKLMAENKKLNIDYSTIIQKYNILQKENEMLRSRLEQSKPITEEKKENIEFEVIKVDINGKQNRKINQKELSTTSLVDLNETEFISQNMLFGENRGSLSFPLMTNEISPIQSKTNEPVVNRENVPNNAKNEKKTKEIVNLEKNIMNVNIKPNNVKKEEIKKESNQIKSIQNSPNDPVLILEDHKQEVKFLIFIKERSQLLTVCDDLIIRLFSIPSGELVDKLLNFGRIFCIKYMKSLDSIIYSTDNFVSVYNFQKKLKSTLPSKHLNSIKCVGYDSTTKIAFSGATDQLIYGWDLASSTCIKKYEGNTTTISTICTIKSKGLIVSGSMEGKICLFDINNQNLVKSFDAHAKKQVKIVKYINSKDLLATGSDDRTIKIWNYMKGELLKTIKSHKLSITDLHFFNGIIVSSSVDKTIQFSSLNGENLGSLAAHKKSVENLCKISNCDIVNLASCGADKSVKLWKIGFEL